MLSIKNLGGELTDDSVTRSICNYTTTVNMTVERSKGSSIEICDENDSAMHTIIDSYNFGNFTPKSNPDFYISGQQAILHLNDLDFIGIKLVCNFDLSNYHLDKDELLVTCAMESILKKLHANDCVKRDAVCFQTRRGSHLKGNLKVSGLNAIFLNPEKKNESVNISFNIGLISHCYAYLDEKRLCIFFNPITQAQENKIKSVLNGMFQERQYEPQLTSSNQQKLISNKK